MNKQLQPTNNQKMTLHRRELYRISDVQPGMAIECKEGVLWVTSAGDARDYLLYPGDHYLPTGKKVVVEAMRDAQVSITSFGHN